MERGGAPTRRWNSMSLSEAHIPPLGDNYCQCSGCRDITETTKSLTNMQQFGPAVIDLCVGDRVMVDGYLPGVVKYVGDLDSNLTNSPTYVGVKLDDPVGDNDGIANGKRYFSCSRPQAVFVEINRVALTVPVKFRPWDQSNHKRNSSLYRTSSCINSPSLLTTTTHKTHRASLPSTINKKGSLTCQSLNYGSTSMANKPPPTRHKSLPINSAEINTAYNNGFTSKLLSTLPDDDITLPDLPAKSFTDVNQFAAWMHTWGGGIRGWTMASTLQKLKDAHRKGIEEKNWKKTISQLERNGGYDTQIRRIKKLQDEIHSTQASTLAAEEEYTRLAYSDYKSQQEVGQINQQMHKESLKCQELEAAIRDTIQISRSKRDTI